MVVRHFIVLFPFFSSSRRNVCLSGSVQLKFCNMCDIIVVINCGNIKLDIELQFYVINSIVDHSEMKLKNFPQRPKCLVIQFLSNIFVEIS